MKEEKDAKKKLKIGIIIPAPVVIVVGGKKPAKVGYTPAYGKGYSNIKWDAKPSQN